MKKIILDLCGGTGSWSKPYKDAGYDVLNITLPNFDITESYFWKGSVYFQDKSIANYLEVEINKIHGILAAPPCTMFSFARTNAKLSRNLKGAMNIVNTCLRIIHGCQYELDNDCQKKPPLKFWALENPNGMLNWFLGKPAFIFNPFDFGDNYKKKTCLWGHFNEPKKNPVKCDNVKFDKMKSKNIAPTMFGKLTRKERRAITPQGFAKAFFEANK